MGYAENNLQHGEAIVVRAQFSMWGAVGGVIGMIITVPFAIVCFVLGGFVSDLPSVQIYCVSIGVFLLVFGVFLLIFTVASTKSNELVVTNKRVIGKHGILGKHIIDIPIDKVDSVSVQIPFFGQLFHYNSIRINTAGSYSVGVGNAAANIFPAVTNANEIKNVINEAIERHAAEARRSQAYDIADMLQRR